MVFSHPKNQTTATQAQASATASTIKTGTVKNGWRSMGWSVPESCGGLLRSGKGGFAGEPALEHGIARGETVDALGETVGIARTVES